MPVDQIGQGTIDCFRGPMLLAAIAGLFAVSATVLIQAAGTTWWLHRLQAGSRAVRPSVKSAHLLSVLVKTALVLITLHVFEVLVWALLYRLLPESGLATLEEAVYFSFTTFTTLGYGDIVLAKPWRLLTGIESLNGVLLIGWSTALSFAVIERVWSRLDHPSQTH